MFYHRTSHRTSNVSLRYLVKHSCSKLLISLVNAVIRNLLLEHVNVAHFKLAYVVYA